MYPDGDLLQGPWGCEIWHLIGVILPRQQPQAPGRAPRDASRAGSPDKRSQGSRSLCSPSLWLRAPQAAKPLCGRGAGVSAASALQIPGRAPPGLPLLNTFSGGGDTDGCTAGNIPWPRPAAHTARRQKEPVCTDTGTWQHRGRLCGAHPGLGTLSCRICWCQGAKCSKAELAGPFCRVPRAPDPCPDSSPPAGAGVASETERHARLLTF